MARLVKLTQLQTNPAPMHGDSVVMPPKDSYWIDARRSHLALPGYPETSLMAAPDVVPTDAPHLVPENKLPGHVNDHQEYFYHNAPMIPVEYIVCFIAFVLAIQLILMFLLLAK